MNIRKKGDGLKHEDVTLKFVCIEERERNNEKNE